MTKSILTLEFLGQILILGLILTCTRVINDNFIFLAFTIDSLFSSIGFLRINLIENLSQSQTLTRLYSLYQFKIIDRYLYYISLTVLYNILKLAFWGNYYLEQVLYLVLIVTLCPTLLNVILSNYFGDILFKINVEKTRLLKVLVSKAISKLVNFMSEVSLDLRPELHYMELMPIFRNRHQTVRFFYSFISSFIFSTLIHYLKTNSNKFYAKLIRYFYNLKTGDYIGKIDEYKAKSKITQVIVKREWSDLIRPDVTQSLFYLYKNNQSTDILYKFTTYLHYTVIQISTIWTIAVFFRLNAIIPVLSILFQLLKVWKKRSNPKNANLTILDMSIIHTFKTMINYLIIPLIILITQINYNKLVLTLISELGYIIFKYNILRIIQNWSCILIKTLYTSLTRHNQCNYVILSCIIYLKLVTNICIIPSQNIIVQIPMLDYLNINYYDTNYDTSTSTSININTNTAIKYIIPFMLLFFINNVNRGILFSFITLGYLSNYNIYHLIIIGLFEYVVLNISSYYNGISVNKMVLQDYNTIDVNKTGEYDTDDSYPYSISAISKKNMNNLEIFNSYCLKANNILINESRIKIIRKYRKGPRALYYSDDFKNLNDSFYLPRDTQKSLILTNSEIINNK